MDCTEEGGVRQEDEQLREGNTGNKGGKMCNICEGVFGLWY